MDFWTSKSLCSFVHLRVTDTSLGKFDRKADEGFFVGYSTYSKAFKVFNTRTKIIEENLHITFLENKPNVTGIGPNWMFDINSLTLSMNYQPVFAWNQTNGNVGPKSSEDEVVDDAGNKSTKVSRKENGVQDPAKEEKDANGNRIFTHVSAAGSTYVYLGGSIPVNVATLLNADLPTDPLMPDLEYTVDLWDSRIFSGAYNDEVEGVKADFNNLELTTVISPIPTTRIHKDHPIEKIIGDLLSSLQTRRMTKTSQEHAMSTFLYGIIEEEVYVCQPFGFEDPHFPNKVYKVEKALYGLHQAPRAWYETLSMYLLENRFRRGIIDKTLFIKKDRGELTFFLGLQVMQKDDGIFISQDKFEVTPKVSHLHVVKMIFRYLKGQPKLGLWYPRDLPFDLEAFSDSDYAGASLDRNPQQEVVNFLVFDLEKAKTTQAKEIADLKKRVKKLERKKKLRTLSLKRLWKIEIALVDETQGRMNEEEMFRVNDIDGDEVIVDATTGEEIDQSTKVVEKEVSTADPITTAGEVVTTAEDVEAKDKDKGIMVEPENPLKKKDQIAIDEEVARKLKAQMKAEIEEEERIAREKNEANVAVIKQWDEVQAKTDADMELAQKIQTEE
uniref:Putative ribonuclease H-like domain-containing protein n=1 Tax=Tanacetum cinerariifolium TaxID=118510 RepID=A0A6L2P1S8_TANCI|nr:putative ribonuclease H-like domain-containing protein [Tanacetum cinerariifolium]